MTSTVTNNLETNFYVGRRKFYLDILWLGFMIFTLSYAIGGNVHINLKIAQLFQFIGLILFLSFATLLIGFTLKSSYLTFLLILFIGWSFYVIIRGIHLDYTSVKYLLLDADYGAMFYFVPLILLLPQDFTYFKKLFSVIIILGIFYLIYDVLFIRELLDRSTDTQDVVEILVRNLGMPCGFILLTYKYHTDKKKLLALIVMILSLLFSIYKGRRGLSTTLLCILIPAYFQYLFSTKSKVLTVYATILFMISALMYASSIYRIGNNKLFGFIAQRGTEDTRTPVEDYFYSDMKEKDWIIGRGVNGEYFCPDVVPDQETNYRSLIETGYLQIILKGGLVRLILLLLIALPAVILGLFFSRNILSKAAALWIIMALISLYPATVESFNLQYFLVWISIGICYSKKIRKLPDSTFVEAMRTV